MTTVKTPETPEVVFGIYKVTNPIGEVYIGQSNNIARRWEEHKNTAGDADHKFYQSIRQYGAEYHTFEIVENINHVPVADHKTLLNHLELQHFTLYKNQGVSMLNSNTPNGGRYAKKDRYTQLSINQRIELSVREQEERVAAIAEQELKAKEERSRDFQARELEKATKSRNIWAFIAIVVCSLVFIQNTGKSHKPEAKKYLESVYAQDGHYAFSVASYDSLHTKEVARQIVKDVNTVHGESTISIIENSK